MIVVVPARFNPKKGQFFVHGQGSETADRSLDFGDESAFRAREAITDDAEYESAPDIPLIAVASRAFGTDMTLKEMKWVCDILNAALQGK